MLEALRRSAAEAVELARSAGAAEVFATAQRQRTVLFQQRDDILERVEESTSRGLGLRLYVDGRYSEHGTTDLEPGRLRAFVAEAVRMTRALDPDPDRLVTDPALYRDRPTADLDLVDRAVLDLDPAARRAICGALAEAAHGDERVISATVSVSDVHGETATASSNGFAGDEEWTTVRTSGFVTLREGGDRRPDGYYGVAATHLEDLPAPEAVGREALARALARLGSVQGPTRRATLVVEPWMATSLIGRLLGPANAEAWSQERSYFRGRMGEALFAERLTIVDDPLIPRALGSRHYDREGISARRLPLVEAGRPRGLYVDTYYGRKIDMAPTTGSSSNVVVRPGEGTLESLLSAAGDAVLVTTWIGGNSDPTTGEFSIGMRGHLVEGGRVGAPVGEMNVSGELLGLFRRLAAAGEDPWVYGTARVPTLVFEDVQLSGA